MADGVMRSGGRTSGDDVDQPPDAFPGGAGTASETTPANGRAQSLSRHEIAGLLHKVARHLAEHAGPLETPCLLYTAPPAGPYPRLRVRGTWYSVHRIAYEAFIGPIPEGYEVDHRCRVARCVNYTHLEPVTPQENKRRRNAAKTHCKHGHPLEGRNVWERRRRTHIERVCRTCKRRRRGTTAPLFAALDTQ